MGPHQVTKNRIKFTLFSFLQEKKTCQATNNMEDIPKKSCSQFWISFIMKKKTNFPACHNLIFIRTQFVCTAWHIVLVNSVKGT